MRIVYKSKRSRLEVLDKKCLSKNFGKFSGKHPRWGPVLIKLQGTRPSNPWPQKVAAILNLTSKNI